jgi:hypothetical protein
MFVGFVVFPLLILLQALVVTDRERLVSICQAVARAVQHGDVAGVAEYVSPQFTNEDSRGGRSIDKALLIETLEQLLSRYDVEEPRLRQFEVEVDGAEAVVCFSASCRIITPDQIIAPMGSAWELTFARSEGRWRVIDIRPRPTPLFPYERLSDIPR